MDRYSRESGGRLIVTTDEFIQPPTTASRASQTGQRRGHTARLASGIEGSNLRRQRPLRFGLLARGDDSNCDAPGASDDASGTAVVMEMARVMSKYQFDATLVFMAVAGEEQGLLGAAHWAEEAKKKNLNIAAMFTNDIVGNTLGGNGVKDNARIRVFSEGVPSKETEAEARIRQSNGGENDGPSRQLARYIKEAAERT